MQEAETAVREGNTILVISDRRIEDGACRSTACWPPAPCTTT
jgi:hypothetical protein